MAPPWPQTIECLYSWGPVKILLVEDDRQTADYIAKGLREHGHVVDQADNGRDGLYLATGEPYDVMIVDRMLPEHGRAVAGQGARAPPACARRCCS